MWFNPSEAEVPAGAWIRGKVTRGSRGLYSPELTGF